MAFTKKSSSGDMDEEMARCVGSGKSMRECLGSTSKRPGKKKGGKKPPFGRKHVT
jgi:hypothetical protein